jgi:dTDP-4-dehydrorhamnose 3,5-epimerase
VNLEPDTEVQYKVDAPYSRAHDGAVRFDDPTIAIDWSINAAEALPSDKDAATPGFHDFDTPFRYEPTP